MRIGETIYLDYQASTPMDPRVLRATQQAAAELFANPHSADHALGWKAAEAIKSASARVGSLFGLDGGDVIFTSGASESNAMAARTASFIAANSERTELLVGEGDHGSMINEATSSGLSVKFIPLDQRGAPDAERLAEMLSPRTALVSIIGVNNENGSIADLGKISDHCVRHGALLHADLAQAPVALDIDLLELNIPLATVAAHKIYGPKGVGALLTGPGIADLIRPVIRGAGQQQGQRGGTMPTDLIVGFGEACRLISERGHSERAKVSAVRDHFVETLQDRGVARLVGAVDGRHPGNALMHFPGTDASDLLSRLQPFIAASTQSACSSGKVEPSRVLQAMGHDKAFALGCIRFSFGRFSDIDQVTLATSIIFDALNARAVSAENSRAVRANR